MQPQKTKNDCGAFMQGPIYIAGPQSEPLTYPFS
ncbi:unnamed protein product [Penicillium camemberti]|uniref:Str. FM013 n=1 Tax=Penicillium camemberti (strain FM 013) TaxID=1429867 RepID=A0A0G4PF13_PENC3|nr:unnamed protein product [Penicillium camemberti]